MPRLLPATQSGFYWVVSPDLIADNLEIWTKHFMDRLEHELSDVGIAIESWAKSNHPWSNITGAAESSIAHIVERVGNNFHLILWYDTSNADGAEHGYWLEIRWNGKWGVIRIALEGHYDAVMGAVRRAVNG